MSWYQKIKAYYTAGLWTLSMVKNAVIKGKITTDEYKEITGNTYIE